MSKNKERDLSLNLVQQKEKKSVLDDLQTKRRPSFIAPNLNELSSGRQSGIKKPKVATKIVNTRISKEVFTSFLLYCAKQNGFRKEVFPQILQHLIQKWDNKFELVHELQGLSVSFDETMVVNFEYDKELFQAVQEIKARHHIKYKVIYEQAILHYINDKTNNLIT